MVRSMHGPKELDLPRAHLIMTSFPPIPYGAPLPGLTSIVHRLVHKSSAHHNTSVTFTSSSSALSGAASVNPMQCNVNPPLGELLVAHAFVGLSLGSAEGVVRAGCGGQLDDPPP
jgi:hypothetical protein